MWCDFPFEKYLTGLIVNYPVFCLVCEVPRSITFHWTHKHTHIPYYPYTLTHTLPPIHIPLQRLTPLNTLYLTVDCVFPHSLPLWHTLHIRHILTLLILVTIPAHASTQSHPLVLTTPDPSPPWQRQLESRYTPFGGHTQHEIPKPRPSIWSREL